jgi:RNA polymerase sigma factor for flagellar operon FliA
VVARLDAAGEQKGDLRVVKSTSRTKRIEQPTAQRGGTAQATKPRRKSRSKDDPIELWKEYQAKRTIELRNQLIEYYLPVVRYTAERLAAGLPQSVDVEDLMSAGLFGLMESIKTFDLDRGVKFKTYCSWRIRGAILDQLRANDWVPRLVRSKASKLEKKMREAEAMLGRPATDLELASLMGMSLGELDKMMRDASAVTVCYLSDTAGDNQDSSARSDLIEDKGSRDPIQYLQRKDVLEVLTRELTMRERLIVILYYFEELTMREIGMTLDLSESRVCQLHSRIIARLKSRLGRRRDELTV